MLFQSLLALFETMLMMLIEKNTPKTPANSGLPSSTVRSKIRSGRQRRKQSHDECGNARLEQTAEISPVEHGEHGGHDWTRIAVQDHERRALMDVVFVTHEHHVKTLIKCGRSRWKAENETKVPANRATLPHRQYRRILIQGVKELPALPKRKSAKGKSPKTTAHNLHQAFQNCENGILRFARNPSCPYSNNAAERFHQMSKVKQKMSGTFRSVKMAQACCRITSCLQAMNLPGYNPLTATEWVLKGDAIGILEEKLENTATLQTGG